MREHDHILRPGAAQASVLASLLVTEPADHSSGPRISEGALRAIRLHLGMDVAFISELTATERVFRSVDAASPDSPIRAGDADPIEDSYCVRVVDGRLPELIPDAAALPAAARLAATSRLPVGAHLSVPIRLADGRVYGTFCCFSAGADHSLNERDLAMMRVFADLTGAQIDADLEQERTEAARSGRLVAAIDGEGLSMVFQPIVDIESRRVIGFESLARFDLAPQRGPDLWFADAAAAGLGVELELATVALALRDLPHLPIDAYLAVNVSPATVISGRLDALLGDAPPQRIVLEITEHAAIEAYGELERALRGVRARGVRIAVDDAGAGYASFRHILRLRPDIIKLDMTLTRDIDVDRSRRALASALIRFAGETGSAIVAEGVETAEELRTLKLLGATAAQGYHLGAPADPPGARTLETLTQV